MGSDRTGPLDENEVYEIEGSKGGEAGHYCNCEKAHHKVKKYSFEPCALSRWKTSGSGYLRRVRKKARDEDEDSLEFELTVGVHL